MIQRSANKTAFSARRHDCYAIVRRHLLIGAVQVWLIPAGAIHAGTRVVGIMCPTESEQLSADQLALFAELLQAREAQAESPGKGGDSDDDAAGGGNGEAAPNKRAGGRQPLSKNLQRERIVHDLAEEEKHCTSCQKICGPSGKNPASATNTFRRN
jgi:hypothetical protein